MPWTPLRYPPAMEALPEPVREKAIEIANALLEEGMDDGRAIRIAIAKAKEWAARRTLEID
ncbi:MAG TPA: hypothetical protein DEP35_20290 [Deltaproteobacteria bacterium]|nr:hypothetical protein [Deltaproteobacteria bacterium]